MEKQCVHCKHKFVPDKRHYNIDHITESGKLDIQLYCPECEEPTEFHFVSQKDFILNEHK